MPVTRVETRTLLAAAAVALLVVIVGTAVHHANGSLGTAQPPFVMQAEVSASITFLLAAMIACPLAVALAPWLHAGLVEHRAFLATAALGSLALALVINAARDGTSGWSNVFDIGPQGSFEAKNEILGGTQALSYGVGFFLDRFAELAPAVPVHMAGHPPGLPIATHWLGLDSAGGLAALCIAALAALSPATYLLSRSLGREQAEARLAALLAMASPALILFGVSSPDAVFALAGVLSAALLVNERSSLAAVGCVALAAATMLSWLSFALAAWAVLVVWRRFGLRRATAIAAGCALACIAAQATLAATTGWDPIGSLRATKAVYDTGISSIRPYWFWVFGSPTAFLAMMGIPIAGGWLVACVRGSAPALALATIIALSALVGLTEAEVERIWLPYVPIACVAAAEVLQPAQLRWSLGLLLGQALLVSLLFGTVW